MMVNPASYLTPLGEQQLFEHTLTPDLPKTGQLRLWFHVLRVIRKPGTLQLVLCGRDGQELVKFDPVNVSDGDMLSIQGVHGWVEIDPAHVPSHFVPPSP